jgi:hypothetical protein
MKLIRLRYNTSDLVCEQQCADTYAIANTATFIDSNHVAMD